MNFVVIGAGPTGLGVLYRLNELGRLSSGDHVVLLECSADVGGLAQSVQDPQGFWWDLGGHVTFSHYDYFTAVIDDAIRTTGNGWSECHRASYVFLRGKFVGYPLQQNIHCLDEPTRSQCIEGLTRRRQGVPANFDEWILNHFGEPVADLFMRPYNRKVWTVDPLYMNYGWVGERVAVPTVDEIRKKLEGGAQDTGWGPNATFRFPLRGATGSIWKGVACLIPSGYVHFNNTVTEVQVERRQVSLTDATGHMHALPYDVLINTAPVDVLLSMAADCDEEVLKLGAAFVHNQVHVVGIGLRGTAPASLADKTWMYFPEPDIPFYRMTVFSNYSPFNAPSGCWSVMLECAQSSGGQPTAADAAIAACVQALKRLSFIDESCIVSRFHRCLEPGYPVPFLTRDEVLPRVQGYLQRHGIYSRGRFGAWKYEVANQDHSFMQGVEVVDRILSGVPETTWLEPEIVNSGVRPGRHAIPPAAAPAVQLVVSHYREDLSWLEPFKSLAHVYHKGGQPDRYDCGSWERLPNVGRESHTYLHHIIHNYDHLADVTVFLQGGVTDHLPPEASLKDLVYPIAPIVIPHIVRLREWGEDGRIDWTRSGIFFERLQRGDMRPAEQSLVDWFRHFVDMDPLLPGWLRYTPGAIMSVQRTCIRRRSRSFYERLMTCVSDHCDPEEGHYLERSWLYVFGLDDVQIHYLTS